MNTKHLKTLCLSALLLGTACGSDDGGDGSQDPGKDQQQLKNEVRAACDQADEEGTERPTCPDAWLGDGVCDDFCQDGDAADCTVRCAAIGCEDGDDGDDGDGGDGDDGIACPAIWTEPDNECDPEDPCGPFTDPDCASCNEVFPQDGCCDATPSCADHDPDCEIACTAEVKTPDGVCNNDFCDPDCQAACQARDGDDGEGSDPGCPSDNPEECEVHTTGG